MLQTGRELWRTDGTAGGTFLLADIAAGPSSSNPSDLTQLGSQFFFSASSIESGTELWVTDGTPAGTRQVTDIVPGPESSYPSNFVALNGSLYFTAYTQTSGSVVWKSDGSTTVQVSSSVGSYQNLQPFHVGNYALFNRFDTSSFEASNAVAIDSLTNTEQSLGIPLISTPAVKSMARFSCRHLAVVRSCGYQMHRHRNDRSRFAINRPIIVNLCWFCKGSMVGGAVRKWIENPMEH